MEIGAGDKTGSFRWPYPSDTIVLRSLHTKANIGLDAWDRKRPQPVLLSVRLKMKATQASTTDDVNQTFSYGTIAKKLTEVAESKEYDSIKHLLDAIKAIVEAEEWPGEELELRAQAPKAMLRSVGTNGTPGREGQGLGCEIKLGSTESGRRKEDEDEVRTNAKNVWHEHWTRFDLGAFPISCIIGVNAPERKAKQLILIRLQFVSDPSNQSNFTDENLKSEGWRSLEDQVCLMVEDTKFETVEALGSHIISFLHDKYPFLNRIRVGLEKPSAITFAEGAGVEIERARWKSRIES